MDANTLDLPPRPGDRQADVPARSRTQARQHKLLGLGLLVLVVATLSCVSVVVGARSISPAQVWHALGSYDPADAIWIIVRRLRVPRTLLGLAVGVALGLAGTLMQGLTRNPLAEPGLLGVNSGAALAVVSAIAFLHVQTPAGYVWFALLGAAVAAIIVYALGSIGRADASPVTLVLAGATLTALLQSVITLIILRDNTTFDQFRFWQVGSLAGRELSVLGGVLPVLAVGMVIALSLGRSLNALALGDDLARSLGQRVRLVRVVAALAIVLLCGGATAAAGPIAFVGLAVPHVARMLIGADLRWILAYSGLLAPALLLTADVVGRVVARPGELQVGVVTALIGAPLLIVLVRRRRVIAL